MVLVDTSVWIDHLRRADPHLQDLLRSGQVAMHPYVVGEIACGSLANRSELLALLQALPQANVATHEEVMALIERRSLHGKGLGLVDVHLLSSALLGHLPLWTRDKPLRQAATVLQIAYTH